MKPKFNPFSRHQTPRPNPCLAVASVLALGSIAAFLLQSPARAADFTWDGGGGDGNWGTAANWTPDGAPTPSSTNNLIFAGTTNLAPINNYTDGDDFQDITFDSTAGAFTINNTGTNGIDWFGSINNNSTNTQTIGFRLYQSASNTINATSGNVTLNSSALVFRNGQALTLNAASGKTIQIDSVIADGGGGAGSAINVSGAGTVILTGANTYTSGTTLSGGILRLDNAAALSTTNGTIRMTGGTLQYGTGITTDYSGRLTTATGQSFSVDTNGNNVSWNTAIQGTGNTLTKLGTGTLTLGSTTSSYTGGTTISEGTISISNNNNTGTGGIALNGGTLRTTAGITTTRAHTIGASGGTIQVTTTGQYFFNTANTLLGSGALAVTGNGTLTANTSNLRIGQTQTYNGAVTINNGGIFEWGVANALASTAITLGNQGEFALNSGVTLGSGVTVTVNGGTNSVLSFINGTTGNYASSIVLNANAIVGLRDWYANGTVRSGTISGNISGTSSLTVNSGTGSGGTLTLSGTNTYGSGTTINSSTAQFTKLVAMPASGAVTVNTGSTLAVNLGGTGEWTTGTSGNGTVGGLLAGLGGQNGGTVTYAGNVTLGLDTTNASGTQTYSGNIANVGTTLGINKLGTGTLALSGANTYTGQTTVNAGTLNLIGSATSAGSLVVNNSGANSVVNFASGAGAYTYNNANMLVGNNGTAATAGVVNQSAGTITGVNQLQIGAQGGSYGAYNLSGGSIGIQELDLGGFNGAPNGVMDISGGTLNASNWLIVSRGSGGTGLLNMTGGTVNFTGTTANQFLLNYQANASQTSIINIANANFTATNATGGVLDLMKSGAAGQKGIVNLLSGGVMQVQGVKATNTTGTSHFNFNGGTLKASTANTTFLTGLTAANVYSGGGTIDNNNVNITVGQALLAPTGSGANSNPTVTAGGSGYISAPIVTVSGTGGSGATAYATVSGGVVTGIVVTSPGTGYTGPLSFTLTGGGGSGATIGTVTQTANTSGGMSFAGSGTTTLSGTNTYTGATTINAGTVSLTGSLASPSLTVNNGSTFSYDKTGTNTQSFTSGTTINGGGFIKNTVSTDTLNLGAITLGTKATLMLTTTGVVNNTTYTSSNLTNGILTAAITASGGADWAVADASGNLSAYTGYTSVTGNQTGASASAQNWKNTGNTNLTTSATINSLNVVGGDFTINAGQTLTLGSGGLILGSTERWLKAGDTTTSILKSGLASGELYIHANATGFGNGFQIQTVVTDGSVASAVIKDGPGQVEMGNGNNTFSGGFYLNSGAVYLGGSSTGSGNSVTKGPLGTGTVTLNAGTLNVWGKDNTTGNTGGYTLGNNVVIVGSSVTIDASTSGALSGVVSGSGPLVKTGANTLTLSGANTYTGATTISAGTLQLGNGGTTGTLSTSSALSFASGATLAFNRSNAVSQGTDFSGTGIIGTNAVLTQSGTGTVTLTAANSIKTLNVNNATGIFNIGSGNLTITNTGGNTIQSTTGGTINATGGGKIVLSQNSATDGPDIGTANGTTLTINANITGTSAFESWNTANGTGVTVLTGQNDYTNNTIINAGVLSVSNIGNTGSTTSNLGQASTINISSVSAGNNQNSTLRYTGTGETTNRVINFFLNGNNTGGIIDQSGASGLLKFTSNQTSTGTGTKTLTLQGSTAGTGEFAGNLVDGSGTISVTKTGTGTWTLSGANTYTGKTTVSGGTFQFAKTASLYNGTTASWTAANITAASGATLAMNVGGTGEFAATDVNTLLTNISVASSSNTGLQAGAKLGFDTTNATGGTFTQGTAIADSTGANGGAIGATKLGTGTLVFDKTNTYSGATTVSAGKLIVSGSIANSDVTVSAANTTLATGTTGTIGKNVTINSGAILAAGDINTAGTATVTTNTTFNDGSIFSWDISSDGATYDKLATLGLSDGDVAGGTVFRVVAADSTFANGFWNTTRTWGDIFTTDGSSAISNWASLFTTIQVYNAGGSSFTPVNGSFSVSGSTLTWNAVPEPSSPALVGLLVGAALLRRRRK